jgi:hypothetical protein
MTPCVGCEKPTDSAEKIIGEIACPTCAANWRALTKALGDELPLPQPRAGEKNG